MLEITDLKSVVEQRLREKWNLIQQLIEEEPDSEELDEDGLPTTPASLKLLGEWIEEKEKWRSVYPNLFPNEDDDSLDGKNHERVTTVSFPQETNVSCDLTCRRIFDVQETKTVPSQEDRIASLKTRLLAAKQQETSGETA